MPSYRNDRIYFETPRGRVVSRVYTKGANKGKLYWRIDWAPGFGPHFTQAFTTAQAAFAQEVAKQMDKYVPLDTGTLKNSVHLASNYQLGILIYATPYARRQYYLHPMGTNGDRVQRTKQGAVSGAALRFSQGRKSRSENRLSARGEGVRDVKGGPRGSYWGQRCDADFHPYFVRFARRAVRKEMQNR